MDGAVGVGPEPKAIVTFGQRTEHRGKHRATGDPAFQHRHMGRRSKRRAWFRISISVPDLAAATITTAAPMEPPMSRTIEPAELGSGSISAAIGAPDYPPVKAAGVWAL